MVFKKMLCACIIALTSLALYAQAVQTPAFSNVTNREITFFQTLSWTMSPYIEKYEFILRDDADSVIFKTETTEGSIILSLKSGQYTFKIISYNILGQAESETEWKEISIEKTNTPVIHSISTNKITSDLQGKSNPEIIYIEGRDFAKDVKVFLVSSEVSSEKILDAVIDEYTSQALAVHFDMKDIAAGRYFVRVVNPGNFTSEVPLVYEIILPPVYSAEKNLAEKEITPAQDMPEADAESKEIPLVAEEEPVEKEQSAEPEKKILQAVVKTGFKKSETVITVGFLQTILFNSNVRSPYNYTKTILNMESGTLFMPHGVQVDFMTAGNANKKNVFSLGFNVQYAYTDNDVSLMQLFSAKNYLCLQSNYDEFGAFLYKAGFGVSYIESGIKDALPLIKEFIPIISGGLGVHLKPFRGLSIILGVDYTHFLASNNGIINMLQGNISVGYRF